MAKYSTGQLAEIVGCATKTIREKVNKGELPVAEIQGNYRYFDDNAIIKYFRDTNLNACTLVKDTSMITKERKPKNLYVCTGDSLEDYVASQYIEHTVGNCIVICGDNIIEIINKICRVGVINRFTK